MAAAPTGSTYARRLSQASLPPGLRQAATDLLAIGEQVTNAAERMFELDAELSAYAETQARQAEAALSNASTRIRGAAAARVSALQATADRARQAVRTEVEWLSSALVALLVLSGMLVIRLVATPICVLSEMVQRITSGETAFVVPSIGRRDEIGRLAAALEHLRGVSEMGCYQSQVIDQSPVGISLVDPATMRVTYVNAAMEAQSKRLGLAFIKGAAITDLASDLGVAASLAEPSKLPYFCQLAACSAARWTGSWTACAQPANRSGPSRLLRSSGPQVSGRRPEPRQSTAVLWTPWRGA